jgi:hypothetical protein
MTSNVDAHLEIIPESTIEFTLNEHESTPKVTMTLRHPDPDSSPVAFKVKTTQPRRYLVRPNQGLIEPGGSEEVQIVLVEKDKASLMESYQRLGQSALDHSKDKFLVQSVAVDQKRAVALKDYDQLTTLWTQVSSQGSNAAVANKKLHVKHTVDIDGAGAAGGSNLAENINPAELSKDQLMSELTSLRRKYDELVAFSVNLTAERDILNNTLEQTKRDLQRQMTKVSANENSNNRTGAAQRADAAARGSSPFRMLGQLILCVALLLAGAFWQEHAGLIPAIQKTLSVGKITNSGTPKAKPQVMENQEPHRQEL